MKWILGKGGEWKVAFLVNLHLVYLPFEQNPLNIFLVKLFSENMEKAIGQCKLREISLWPSFIVRINNARLDQAKCHQDIYIDSRLQMIDSEERKKTLFYITINSQQTNRFQIFVAWQNNNQPVVPKLRGRSNSYFFRV